MQSAEPGSPSSIARVLLPRGRPPSVVWVPAGLVAAEDAVVFEMIQNSIKNGSVDQGIGGLLEMGGRGTEETDFFWTEAPVRGFYKRYAEVMGFDVVDARAAE